jgi:hypothetical protein
VRLKRLTYFLDVILAHVLRRTLSNSNAASRSMTDPQRDRAATRRP